MRTISLAQNAVLLVASRTTALRIRIKDSGGTFVDYDDLRGINWIEGADWGQSIDNEALDAIIVLGQKSYELNLSPFMSAGALTGHIDIGRDVEIQTATVPEGTVAAPSDYQTMFKGTIDGHRKQGNFLQLKCRSTITGRLQDAFIETEVARGGVGVGTKAVEVVMQDIMNGDVPSPTITLNIPTSPLWNLHAFSQRRESVMRAIRTLAHQIGWSVHERWDNTAGDFGLYFEEPDRVTPSVVRNISADEYRTLDQLEVAQENVRNVVKVIYYDGTLNNDGSPKESEIIRTANDVGDAASIPKYRRRFMEVAEASTSNIDTSAEAIRLAESLVRDLKDPEANHAVTMPYFWPMQLRDFYRWKANGIDYDVDQELAVFSFRHTHSRGALPVTSVLCTGKPRGGFTELLRREFKPGGALNRREAGPISAAAITVSAQPLGNVVSISRTPDHTWNRFEIHRSTTAAFTPTPSTFLGFASSDTFVDKSAALGDQHYYKVFAVDRFNNPGPVSNQASGVPALIGTAELAPDLQTYVDVVKTSNQTGMEDDDLLTWEDDPHDRNGDFVLSSEKFVAPAAGVYAMALRTVIVGEPTSFTSYRNKVSLTDNTVLAEGTEADLTLPASLLSAFIPLNEGDEVVARIVITGGSTNVIIDDDGTRWQIVRVPSGESRT